VGNGIDEAVVLFVAAYFADEKAGVEDQTGNDGAEENHAQHDFYVLLPVEDDPTEANRNRSGRQQDAERQKETNFAAPGNPHTAILARQNQVSPTWFYLLPKNINRKERRMRKDEPCWIKVCFANSAFFAVKSSFEETTAKLVPAHRSQPTFRSHALSVLKVLADKHAAPNPAF
jgi:hypothetical protein